MSMLTGGNPLRGPRETWTLRNARTGRNAVTFTSFIGAEITDEGKVVSGPVEEGSFASYNKTDSPLDVKVTLGMQGDNATLQEAIDALEQLRFSTDLVNLVTPVVEYEDLNLEKFSYSLKREDGRGCLYVDLHLVEIIEVEAQYTNARLAPQQNRGKVQAKDAGKKQQGGNTSAAAGIKNWITGKK